MRYELTDFEWTAIRPFLPNKPRGIPRATTEVSSTASSGFALRRDIKPIALGRVAPGAHYPVDFLENPAIITIGLDRRDIHDGTSDLRASIASYCRCVR